MIYSRTSTELTGCQYPRRNWGPKAGNMTRVGGPSKVSHKPYNHGERNQLQSGNARHMDPFSAPPMPSSEV